MDRVDDFDPSAYMTCPKLDVPSLIALCRQLLAAAPADLPKSAAVCRRRLAQETEILEAGYQTTQAEDGDPNKRPTDVHTDNSWSCLKGRLEPYTWLDEAEFPEAARAKALMGRLFPSGLSFIQLEYGAQWAEASWRIRVIADEKLEPELRRLCGDLFVDELLRWHAEYGQMVGVVAARRGGRTSRELRPNLTDLRRQAGQAVVAWQAQLVALHLSGHAGARAALRPTDDYRDKTAAPPRTPSEPAPPPAPGPVAPPPAPGPAAPPPA